jgi:hypothetical protein
MTMKAVAAAMQRIANYIKELEEQTRQIGDDPIKREEWARRAHLEFLQLLVDSVDAFTKADNALAVSKPDFMKSEWHRLRLMAVKMKKRAQVSMPATADDFNSALFYFGERGTEKDLRFLSEVEHDPPKVEVDPSLNSKEAVDLIRKTSKRIIEITAAAAAPARAKEAPPPEATQPPDEDPATGRIENIGFQITPDAGYNASEEPFNQQAWREPHAVCTIFCPAEEQNGLPQGIKTLEKYDSFIIGLVPESIIDQIRFRYPVETVSQVEIPSSEEAGMRDKVRRREKVIRFQYPVKESWKQAVTSAGATILEPMGSAELLVSVPDDDALKQIRGLEQVISVEDYKPRTAVRFLEREREGRAGDPLREDSAQPGPHAGSTWDSASYSDAILPGILVARFFNSQYREEAEKLLAEQDIPVLGREGADRLVIDALSARDISATLEALRSLPGLRSVEEKTLETPSNEPARGMICAGVASGCECTNPTVVPNLNLDGSGEIVAIADTGLDTGDKDTLHPDFRGRVQEILSYPIKESWGWAIINVGADGGAADRITGHGTHVAGSLFGSGELASNLIDLPIRGVAPAAHLIFQSLEQTPQWNETSRRRAEEKGHPLPGPGITWSIPDDLASLFEPCYHAGARIHSNSWGRPPEDMEGYGDLSKQLDSFVWSHREFLVIVAAGNRAVASNGCIDPMSVESPGTAKNCLTVGATENDRAGEFEETYRDLWPHRFSDPPFCDDGLVDHVDDIAAFSGRGPYPENENGKPEVNKRRKPDVVAPGTYVLSTRSTVLPPEVVGWGRFDSAPDHYMFNGGTSMAAPLVAGCAALVRQFLRERKGMPNPSAALLKAAIIHSSRYRRYRHRHDKAFPWADHEQGWGRVDLKRLLRQDKRYAVEFIDIDRASGFKESGQRRDFKVKVDDASVPLRVTLAYSDFPGFRLINDLNLQVFDPRGRYYLGNDFQHTGNRDSVNNVEGVMVIVPQPGVWTIRVMAAEVQVGPQDFALIVSGGLTLI